MTNSAQFVESKESCEIKYEKEHYFNIRLVIIQYFSSKVKRKPTGEGAYFSM